MRSVAALSLNGKSGEGRHSGGGNSVFSITISGLSMQPQCEMGDGSPLVSPTPTVVAQAPTGSGSSCKSEFIMLKPRLDQL